MWVSQNILLHFSLFILQLVTDFDFKTTYMYSVQIHVYQNNCCSWMISTFFISWPTFHLPLLDQNWAIKKYRRIWNKIHVPSPQILLSCWKLLCATEAKVEWATSPETALHFTLYEAINESLLRTPASVKIKISLYTVKTELSEVFEKCFNLKRKCFIGTETSYAVFENSDIWCLNHLSRILWSFRQKVNGSYMYWKSFKKYFAPLFETLSNKGVSNQTGTLKHEPFWAKYVSNSGDIFYADSNIVVWILIFP